MHPSSHLSPLAVALALSISPSVNAATPVNLQNQSLRDIQQNFQMTLNENQKSSAPALNLLQMVKTHQDQNRMNHVRMQQYYSGFLVFGGYAIAHSKQSVNNLKSADAKMTGVVYKNLDSELGQPSPGFIKGSQQVLEQFKAQYQDKIISEEQIVPMIYIDDQHQAHWAYKVSVFVQHQDSIPERPTAILDAGTHKSFVQWNDLKTERRNVKGIGFGGNNKMGVYQFGKAYPLLDLTRDDEKKMCYMENAEVKVVDMKHRYSSTNKAMKFSCNDDFDNGSNLAFWTGYEADGYDMFNDASSPTNDALYAGYVIKHMYHDWYNEEALREEDGSPMQLVMRVHYGEGYENAYWDGKQMTFGDGDNMMYPLVSLGVGSHEISHGFTEQHSNLMYFGQSGGMNEAFSDIAAQAAEYYSVGQSSWQIGAEIMKEDSGWDALRYMDRPSKDGRSIDSADDYYGGLDVHYSSGVYNHLFYLMANHEGWDTRKAFDVMVKANMDYWTPYTDFNKGGCGVLSAAEDLGYSVEDVKQSLNEVDIALDVCEGKPE